MHGNAKLFASIVLILTLILAACSEAPKSSSERPKEPEKPAEPITGRRAFHQMFVAARTWAPDVEVLGLSSIHMEGVQEGPGETGAWQATFVSPSRGKAKMFTYSVVEGPGNLHKGVFAGLEENFMARGQAKPFNVAAIKTDSDAVYKTALEHGKEYSKKNPDLPISFVLELTPRFPNPAWRVIWGESVSSSNFSIFVDASTGEYLQTMR